MKTSFVPGFVLTLILCLLIGCDGTMQEGERARQSENQADIRKENASMNESPKQPTTFDDVVREADQAIDAAGEYSKQKAAELREDMRMKMEMLDAKIADLKREGKELSEDARVEWQQKLDQLQQKREALSNELSRLQNAAADSWDAMRGGLKDAWKEIGEAYDEAAARFEETRKAPEPQKP